MALIECSECNGKVSTKATSCPHCGLPGASSTKVHAESLAEEEMADIKCPECGSKFSDQPSFCHHCSLSKPLNKHIEAAICFKKLRSEYKNGEYLFNETGKNGLYSGWVKWLESDGQIRLGEFEGGKEHGKSIGWHGNGEIKWIGNCKNRKKEGVFVYWRENGLKECVRTYKKGMLDGIVVDWYENGQRECSALYKEGKREGPFTCWRENGKKKRLLHYENDKKEGLFVDWRENGQRKRQGYYKAGKWDGPLTSWHENGLQKCDAVFQDGKLWTASVWKPNGDKCPVSKVVNGNGVLVEYDDDGTESGRETIKEVDFGGHSYGEEARGYEEEDRRDLMEEAKESAEWDQEMRALEARDHEIDKDSEDIIQDWVDSQRGIQNKQREFGEFD
jgi:antitoxin component YwqK of YwqJK toxin-antitoxin module